MSTESYFCVLFWKFIAITSCVFGGLEEWWDCTTVVSFFFLNSCFKWCCFSCRSAPPLVNDCTYAVLPDSAPQVFAGVCSPGHWRGHLSLQRSDCLRRSRSVLCSECWCLFSVSSQRDAQLPERTWGTKQLCYPWDNSETLLLLLWT